MNKSRTTAQLSPELLSGAHAGGKSRETKHSHSRRKPAGARRFKLRHYLAIVAALAVIGILVGVLVSRQFEWASVSRTIAGFNSAVVILLMAFLPLLGFPISIVYLVAGARYGPLAGLPVVAGITAFHLLATYWITHSFLHAPLQRFLTRRGYHLPQIPAGENAGVCLLGALVPGPPYFARNYLLAFTDIPLRTYFWVCWVVYVVRSYVAILIGDLTSDPDRGQLLLLLGVYVLKLGLCAYVVWRLRRRHRTHAHKT